MWNCILSFVLALMLGHSCLEQAPQAFSAQASQVTADTTFYRVPLMCHAARGLGCGSRAKPVLLDLQKQPLVAEAWLNHTGEILAVVWKAGSTPTDRGAVIETVSVSQHVSIDELDAAARDTALTAFRARAGWHRGTEVDQLSAQEARVIADRLLRRVVATTPTARRKMNALQPVLTEAIRRQLVENSMSAEQCSDALLTAARPHLDKSELVALKDAIGRGFQPVGDEQ